MKDNHLHEDRALALVAEVALQPIKDVEALTDYGVIVDGKCAFTLDNWPMETNHKAKGGGINKRFLNHFNCPGVVNETLRFFSCGDFSRLCKLVGVSYDSSALSKRIGIKVAAC